MTRDEITALIGARGAEAEELRREADEIRRRGVGDVVHVRGIIEFSNYCRCHCAYCGLRHDNAGLERYRLEPPEIVDTAGFIASLGFGTVVLQSGEDMWWTAQRLAGVISDIKAATGMAVTLSVGERDAADYRLWRDAGADRYLLRHETADPELYARMHPQASLENRVRCLENLMELGYQVGTGCIVGLPGQSAESLAEDLLFMQRLNIHMGGPGPLIPHPDTPLGSEPAGAVETVLNMMALVRLLIPDIMMPATTSLETALEGGRMAGLQSGANVIMPNLTPRSVAAKYEIYPGKKAPSIDVRTEVQRVRDLIDAAERTMGTGPGHSPRACLS